MPGEDPLLVIDQVPDDHGAILIGDGDVPAVRAKGQVLDSAGIPLQQPTLIWAEIPDSHSPIAGVSSETLTIRAEGGPVHWRTPGQNQNAKAVAAPGVPEPHGPIRAG